MISDLSTQPLFLHIAADRIWNAWWRQDGHPVDFIKNLMEENLVSSSIPTAFIAHDRDRFLGTVSLIACDMEMRPDYTPWVAALWVDEHYRSKGIGSALIQTAIEEARRLNFATVYLCASADKDAYYAARGWSLIEENIDNLNIYHQRLSEIPS